MAEGKKKKPKMPPPPTEDAVELLVQELTQREPETAMERRVEILLEIREGILRLGGTNVAWLQLSRSRKGYGLHAGLQVLIGMLAGEKVDEAKPPTIDRSSIEPAAQLLAFFCNFKQYAQVIAKTKKLMPALVGVLKDWKCSATARTSATWVLRRCTEFNSQCRFEVASNKDTIVLLSRVMMSDDMKPRDESSDVLTIGGSRSSTPKNLSRNPSAMSRNTSGNNLGSLTITNPMRSSSPSSKPVVQRNLTTPARTESPSGPLASFPTGPPTSASLPSGPDLGPPVTASMPARPITARSYGSQGSFRASRPGTAVTHASRPMTASSMRRPETAQISRPGTALRPGTSGTVFSMASVRADAMCMEANCCAAIGNAALRDDCLERVGQEVVFTAIIQLLGHGTYWAQGHAARTLGNLITCLPNLKMLAKVDVRNMAAHTLHSMLVSLDNSSSSKENALHAIGNMVRSSTFCVVFNQMHGLHSTLVQLKEDGLSKDATDRITACLSQHRLGTRTWRAPTQMTT